MKKRVLIVAFGLAAAFFAFGQSTAKADHCHSGYGGGYGGGYYGGGYGGGYYGGIGYSSAYRVAPIYNYGHGGYYRGHDHHHGYYGGHGHYGHGRAIQVRTPGFSFGLYR